MSFQICRRPMAASKAAFPQFSVTHTLHFIISATPPGGSHFKLPRTEVQMWTTFPQIPSWALLNGEHWMGRKHCQCKTYWQGHTKARSWNPFWKMDLPWVGTHTLVLEMVEVVFQGVGWRLYLAAFEMRSDSWGNPMWGAANVLENHSLLYRETTRYWDRQNTEIGKTGSRWHSLALSLYKLIPAHAYMHIAWWCAKLQGRLNQRSSVHTEMLGEAFCQVLAEAPIPLWYSLYSLVSRKILLFLQCK